MKPFLNTFAKRKAVAMVLLTWLFALAAGVANACLLETPTTHAHIAAAASDGTRVVAVMAGHTGAVAEGSHESSSAKASCLKVCDETSNALIGQPDRVEAAAGPAPLVQIMWLVAAADRVAPFQPDDLWPATTKLPLRLRYSRLAL